MQQLVSSIALKLIFTKLLVTIKRFYNYVIEIENGELSYDVTFVLLFFIRYMLKRNKCKGKWRQYELMKKL